jgi:hypothetical protein
VDGRRKEMAGLGVHVADTEINGHAAYYSLHCTEVFLHKSAAMRALWALVGIGLTLLGSSVTWAFTTSAQLSRVATVVERQDEDIKALQATYRSIDLKLDAIANTSTETNQVIKGFTK